MNTRRAARELALKALFQEDVGKQPRAEVVDGVLDQVRTSVNGPIHQVVQETQVSLRATAASLAGEASPQGSRQIKQAATLCSTELRALAARIAGSVRSVVAETPTADPDSAESDLQEAAAETRRGLRRIAARPSSYPEALGQIAETAERRVEQMVAAFHKQIRPAAQTAAFTVQLVQGTALNQQEIDARLDALATGWRVERQAAVDRNIMRLAAYEMLYVPGIPPGASINEAVELAKKYSTAESGRFVNGVLGALAEQQHTEGTEAR